MSKKILIVEDEKILSEMYRDKLIREGFEVVLANSAEEGIEAIGKMQPDLILLDVLLPRKNGIDFLIRTKQFPKLFLTPIIVFSNFDDPSTKTKALDLGAKEYLIKTNFTPQQIVDKIKDYLTL